MDLTDRYRAANDASLIVHFQQVWEQFAFCLGVCAVASCFQADRFIHRPAEIDHSVSCVTSTEWFIAAWQSMNPS